MKKLLIAAAISTSMAITGCQSTGQSLDPSVVTMNKQMIKMDRAVVLMSDPVKAKPSELNKGTQIGAAVAGGGLATALGGGAYGNRNLAAAGGIVALAGLATMAISEANDQPVPAIRYTLQLMNGKGVSNGSYSSKMTEVIQTVPKGELPIQSGSPVFLKSYSDGSKYVFLDRTQGVVFNKAQTTQFQEDIDAKKASEAKAKKDAENEAKRKKEQEAKARSERNRLEKIRQKKEQEAKARQAKLDAERAAEKKRQQEREDFLWEQKKARMTAETEKLVTQDQVAASKARRDDEIEEGTKAAVIDGTNRIINAKVSKEETESAKEAEVIDAQIRAVDNVSEGYRNSQSSMFQ